MFIVAWTKTIDEERTKQKWEIIDGKDAVDVFVHELITEEEIFEDDIVVGELLDN